MSLPAKPPVEQPFSLLTPSISGLKAEARALREASAKKGEPLSHSAALETVARQHGYRNWNTAAAMLPERSAFPAAVGSRVTGRYLKQPFTGRVLSVRALQGEKYWELTLHFDEPVDVITFESFSAFRQRVRCTLDLSGRSPAKTSDGIPHMQLDMRSPVVP